MQADVERAVENRAAPVVAASPDEAMLQVGGRTARHRHSRRRIAVAALLTALALTPVLEIAAAAAQGVTPRDVIANTRTFLESCPSGHRIEFRSGATSLHVDPSWLETYTLLALVKRFGNRCPGEPVEAGRPWLNGLYFNRTIFVAAGLSSTSLGNSYFKLEIAFVSRREDKPLHGASREPVQQASVLEVARPWREPASETPSRIYDLHYPDDGTGSSTPVRLSCSGGGASTLGRRSCFTPTSYDSPYRYRGVLSVYYVVQQMAPTRPTALASEGDVMLAFDSRIRAWIDSMLVKN